ncbi:hypothetical protein CI109_103248 [Kwoniella shandongensis]|uniref:Mediator of RNA polymerase II transcription subunit 31 n=1 Tax=Kwoniella shandongensis TaxID=1734106 RepID=A0A5M6BX90_9TREE|nr:uncharacterized protein CI109_006080 [Kwoniella shandongensis]KAA5525629.1 hypothetical protein CI109_006080 [Kwoniella shandongensis]
MQQLPTILPPPPLPDGSEAPPRTAEKHANLVRFQSELEFVQCLAHPQYLHELFIQGYLSKPSFLNYLRYLEYWRSPEYVKFIIYPTCLVYLTLLQTELFRSRLNDLGFINELIRVGTKHHETWRVEKPPSAEGPTKPDPGQSNDHHGGDEDDGDDNDGEENNTGRGENVAKGRRKGQGHARGRSSLGGGTGTSPA